jgi:uncharacterized protein YbjT (DUF2867 family)
MRTVMVVVGATGQLGLAICRRLRAQGLAVRALVRHGSPKEREVRDLGVDVVHGDLKDPASLEPLCHDAAAVISTANTILSRRVGDTFASVDLGGHVALLGAARRASVGRIVFVSVSPALPASNAFMRAKRDVEEAVRAGGVPWTILQPAAFMEIHCGPPLGWDFVRARARVLGDADLPRSYVSLHDVAALAAEAAVNPRAASRVLRVTGPARLSAADAVRVMEQVLGRPVRVQRMPRLLLKVLATGLAPFSQVAASLMAMGADGAREVFDMQPIQQEFGLPLTSFEDYVRRAAGRGVVTNP